MKRVITAALSGIVAATLAMPVLAVQDSPGSNGRGRKTAEEATAKARAETVKVAKLEAARKRRCDNQERSIKQRASNFVRHAERHLAVFDKISERTQAFAENHNRQPANYSELVAEVAAERLQVVEDIGEFQAVAAAFDCDSENPEASGTLLKEQAKLVRAGLKEYRTAIKNLIVGVKSANRQNESAGDTE